MNNDIEISVMHGNVAIHAHPTDTATYGDGSLEVQGTLFADHVHPYTSNASITIGGVGIQNGSVALNGSGPSVVLQADASAGLTYTINGATYPVTVTKAAGDIAVCDAAGSPVALGLGADKAVLSVDTTANTRLRWIPRDEIVPLTQKGDLLGFDHGPARIPLGTQDGLVLAVDSTSSTGVAWKTMPNVLSNVGDLLVCKSTGATRFPVGTSSQVLTVDSASPFGLAWKSPTPLAAVGDVLGYSASGLARIPVGANGTVLTADSTATTGVAWRTVPNQLSMLTAVGDLVTYSATGVSKLAVGPAGTVLTADPTVGLAWKTIPNQLGMLTDVGDLVTYSATGVSKIAAGTDGSILVCDSSQATGLRWGTMADVNRLRAFQYVYNGSEVTTSSSTPASFLSMPLTVTSGAVYKVSFSVRHTTTAAGRACLVQLRYTQGMMMMSTIVTQVYHDSPGAFIKALGNVSPPQNITGTVTMGPITAGSYILHLDIAAPDKESLTLDRLYMDVERIA